MYGPRMMCKLLACCFICGLYLLALNVCQAQSLRRWLLHLCSCILNLTTMFFLKLRACSDKLTCTHLNPTLFDHDLYMSFLITYKIRFMGHPNVKVAGASHSMFVAYISSGKDSYKDDRVSAKEQLVFYYIQRSLEVFKATENCNCKT